MTGFSAAKRVVIDTPNPCTKVEKVEGKKIHLKSSKETCIQVVGKEAVEVESSVKSVFVYVDDRYWNEQEVHEFNLESVPEIRKHSESYLENMKVPENIHTEEMKALAGESAKYVKSEEFQKKVNDEKERIKKEVFGSSLERYYADKKQEERKTGKLPPSERIYVFVSSSMPLETLRTYVQDVSGLEDKNIVFVMRGFIGGMKYIKPTAAFIAGALVKDQGCDMNRQKCDAYNVNFEVDPLLFRKYGIAMAPAFVYVPQIEVEDSERSEGSAENARVSDFYTLYGDASFDYILETFHKETRRPTLEALMNALKKGFY